jgi:hypothetical protein
LVGQLRPTKNNVLYAVRKHPRRPRDFYSTPPELTRALLAGLKKLGLALPTPVYDPCAGDGRLVETLGLDMPAWGSDATPDAYPASPWLSDAPVDARDPDALRVVLGPSRSIVTNPPYGRDAAKVARACVTLVERGAIGLAALLLPLPWEAAGSPDRLMLVQHPLMRGRIVACWRPEWVEGTGGGGKMNSAWLVWTRQKITGNSTVYVSKTEAAHR